MLNEKKPHISEKTCYIPFTYSFLKIKLKLYYLGIKSIFKRQGIYYIKAKTVITARGRDQI